MGGVTEYWWALALLLLIVGIAMQIRTNRRIERAIEAIVVTNMPRDGFPAHIEAAWEDVGEHGRFLTDLGGMSVAMREQIYHVFLKALNTPITTTMPAAGSPLDILSDMDEWMTREYKEKDKPLVLVQRG